MDSNNYGRELYAMQVVVQLERELSKVKISLGRRLLTWPDGAQLTIGESMARIQSKYELIPFKVIERHVLCWLEVSLEPSRFFASDMPETPRPVDRWILEYRTGICLRPRGPAKILAMADYKRRALNETCV